MPALLVLSPLFPLQAQQAVQDRPRPASQPRPSERTVSTWQSRKFGMFIHFGLYSQYGGVYHGKPVEQGYSEQIMSFAPIPVQEYAASAATFNPVHWDPDAIVALAKAAGMRYIVLTAKHHDGFNLFATKQTSYNVVDATPYHRDIVKELADACRRGGIEFGVYYSSIDWHQPGMDHYIEGNSNDLSDAHARFNAAQLRELMTNYGPISEIWFDMGRPTPQQSELFATTVHRLQRETMVSGRVWNEQGDFTVMGDNQVPAYGIEEPWETPASIFSDTWGYRSWEKRDDVEGKTREHILHLVQVTSRGGNYILNIGPREDGSVVPFEAEVLRGIGAYLQQNGEAIYNTKAAPFADPSFGYVTVNGRNVYLFVKNPSERIVLPRTAHTAWESAALLHGNVPLKTHIEGPDTVVDADPAVLSGFLSVIKLTTSSGLVVDPKIPMRDTTGNITLTAAAAQKFYNYNGRGYDAPQTLYKLRWYLPTGCFDVHFHVSGSGPVAVVGDGSAHTAQVKDGATEQVNIGTDHLLELTPPEPFVKGARLAVTVQSLDVRPCSGQVKTQARKER